MEATIGMLRQMSDSIIKKEHEVNYLNKILINLIGGLSFINLKNEYETVNSDYADTCGYLPSELIGKQWSITVHPEDLDKAGACYLDMLQNNQSSLIFRGVKKNGDIFNKKITLVKRIGLNNEIIGHYCFMNEVKACV